MKEFIRYFITWICLIALTVGIVLIVYFKPSPIRIIKIEMNGKEIVAGDDLGEIAAETAFTVRGVESYDVTVHAAKVDDDSAFYVLEERYGWNDIEGRDLTAGFEIEGKEDGFLLRYNAAEGVGDILTRVLGLSCRVDRDVKAAVLFRFTLTVGDQTFGFSITDKEYTLNLSPEKIVF